MKSGYVALIGKANAAKITLTTSTRTARSFSALSSFVKTLRAGRRRSTDILTSASSIISPRTAFAICSVTTI